MNGTTTAGSWIASRRTTTPAIPACDVDELVARAVGRGAPIARLRRQRPRLAASSLWAYGCVTGNLRRITDSAASDEWFDGHGRGWREEDAVVGAIAEALERYAACLAGTGAAIRFGSAEDFGDVAVAPERFPRMSQREHERYDLGPAPADGASRIAWYEACDLADGRGALVPAQLVFGGFNLWRMEAQVQFGGSKGLAAHWSDDAAILHGLCEVVEADAFMVTHLNRLPVPEIDLRSAADGSVIRILDAAGGGGIEFLRAWNLTSDCRIPTVLAALGGSLHGGRVVTFGCAAAPDPATAVTKAVQEAIHTTVWMDPSPVAAARTWSRRQLHRVRGRGEHKLLGANPAYLEHLDWLLAPRDLVPVDDMPRLPGTSRAEQLAAAVARVVAAGISCYACDLTPPDVAESIGMRVWRVVAPEAQPFALAPVRYLDSCRLRDVPVALGYRSEPVPASAYNPIPHPCP